MPKEQEAEFVSVCQCGWKLPRDLKVTGGIASGFLEAIITCPICGKEFHTELTQLEESEFDCYG